MKFGIDVICGNGLENYNLSNSYFVLCDANELATAFYIEYRGKRLDKRVKRNRQKVKTAFVSEAVPVATAIRRIPKIYNGSNDAVIVGTDNNDLAEYLHYFFNWDAKETEKLKLIKSYRKPYEMEVVNPMLEKVRPITEAFPIFFGTIKNTDWKDDNVAHLLCSRKRTDILKEELKKLEKMGLKGSKKYKSLLEECPRYF